MPTDVAFAARGSHLIAGVGSASQAEGASESSLALTASNSRSVSTPFALSRAISLSCSTSSPAEGTTARPRLSRPAPAS